jgi:hypothetical protein
MTRIKRRGSGKARGNKNKGDKGGIKGKEACLKTN